MESLHKEQEASPVAGDSASAGNTDSILNGRDEVLEEQDGTTSKPQPQQQRGGRGKNKRFGARNQHRHKHFVRWLEQTFPEAFQQSRVHATMDNGNDTHHHHQQQQEQMHILDIAGGKGETAARLCMCLNQKVVLIDPRPADIGHCFETLVLPKIPNKWQQRLEAKRTVNPKFVQETLDERFQQFTTIFDEQSLETKEDIQRAVQNASLLVGLHADGATEAIVSAALNYQKPFVVVPCCVFPSFFPQRKLRMEDNTTVPVRTHEQFCQYLLQMDPRFQQQVLPFEGRNIAIYWNGKTTWVRQ